MLPILVTLKKRHPSEEDRFLFFSVRIVGSGVDSAQVSSEAARTFTTNNSSTYANPILLYGSKIPSVSERSSISSSHTKSSSKINAADSHSVIQRYENYAIALASFHMLNTGNKFENGCI